MYCGPKASLRFLVDENLPPEVRDLLVEHGHDVVYIPHSTYRAWSDDQLWRLAAAEGRIVVTLDRRFRQPIEPMPIGLVLIRARDLANRSDHRRLFERFMKSSAFDLMPGNVIVIRPGYVRIRPLPHA
jgi:predicted nuclease of predicted toxin-antitoxin system